MRGRASGQGDWYLPKRAIPAHLPAPRVPRSAPPIASNLASPGARGRAFRIRHQAAPPFEWELHCQSEDGPDLVLALPRGLPWAQGEARLAQPVPSPEASLRAPVWDEGRYRTESMDDDEVLLHLEGRRVRGRYALRDDSGRLSLRRVDPASMRPMPDRILPMLAHAASYPERPEEYAFEPKWDGIRALAYLEDGRVTLRSRNLNTITGQYPELAGLAAAMQGRQAILDGEIVAPDETGRPSFQRLQGRMGVVASKLAQKMSEDVPVVYIAFDVLYLDGHDVSALPYEERRGMLEALPIDADHWRISPARIGDGRAFLEMKGWEGVVAKRLGSAYEPGARSRAWVKIKPQRRQELVIAGWTAGRGARAGRIGAILVGRYDVTPDEARERGAPQRFLYAGSVGTGFSQATLEGLQKLLAPDVRATSPFDGPVDKKGATFVEPRYVAEFEFTEWTSDGKLRHPSYKGLREDKDPREVVREEE